MFRSFRSRKKKAIHSLQTKAASVVAAKILWLQHKWTVFMDKRVNRWTLRSQKAGLIVFVALSVLICISILTETFTGAHHPELKIGQLHKVFIPRDPVPLPPARQYDKIVVFQKYMDSLNATAGGRKICDSIDHARPGLLDSAKMLEKLYHNQNK